MSDSLAVSLVFVAATGEMLPFRTMSLARSGSDALQRTVGVPVPQPAESTARAVASEGSVWSALPLLLVLMGGWLVLSRVRRKRHFRARLDEATAAAKAAIDHATRAALEAAYRSYRGW